MRAQESKADHLSGCLGECLAHRDEITLRLCHFGAADSQHAVMHPVTRERAPIMRADTLRDLVLVMRKDQIEPAAVNIEGLAECVFAHRRAFDVPAGAAASPRALPAGLLGC